MNRISHLVAADVRRHRLLLVAWLACIAANTLATGAQPFLLAPALARGAGLVGGLMSLTLILLTLVLIASIVQTHPLVGSTAFWMTRPISADALLLSKVGLLGLLTVAAPALASVVLMGAYGVPAGQMVRVLAQNALYDAFWLVILMVAAALTANLTRFLLLCGGAVACLGVLAASSIAFAMSALEDRPPLSGGDETLDPTSGFVLFALVVVAGLITLLAQYRRRSRVRSITIGTASLLVAFGAAYAWPWPFLAPTTETPPWAATESALALSADPGTVGVSQDVSPFSGRSAWAVVRARLRLGGTPRGWSADVGVVHANLQLEGGLTLESATAGHLAAVPVEGSEERPVRALLRELLGVDRLVPGTPPRGESTIVFYLRDAELGRVAPATGTYRGRFRVQLTSHAIEAALPLERGATHHSGSYRVVLSGMEHGLASASILVRESDATSGFDRSPRSDLNFYLRNRRTRDAIAGHSYDFESRPLLMLLGLSAASNSSGFRARRLMVQFRGDSADGSDSVALDQQWLGDADLVLVRATRQGSVERTLTIPDFPLRVSNTTTGVHAVSPASRSASVLRR